MYRPSVTAVVALLACARRPASSRPLTHLTPLTHRDAPTARLLTALDADRAAGDAGDCRAASCPARWSLVGHRRSRRCTRRRSATAPFVPSVEPMTLDTIFDLASLTKVVATTTARDACWSRTGSCGSPIASSTFIPGFERYGKDRHHHPAPDDALSGLRPDVDLADRGAGRRRRFGEAIEEVPTRRPAIVSSTATSTSSCSAISSGASAASRSTRSRTTGSSRRSA